MSQPYKLPLAPDANSQTTTASTANSNSQHLQRGARVLDFEERLGQVKLITTKTRQADLGGFFCEMCNFYVTDNLSYMKHTSSQEHLSKLGMLRTSESVTIDRVQERILKISQMKNNMKQLKSTILSKIQNSETVKPFDFNDLPFTIDSSGLYLLKKLDFPLYYLQCLTADVLLSFGIVARMKEVDPDSGDVVDGKPLNFENISSARKKRMFKSSINSPNTTLHQ